MGFHRVTDPWESARTSDGDAVRAANVDSEVTAAYPRVKPSGDDLNKSIC